MLSSEQIDEYIFLYCKRRLTSEQYRELKAWLEAEPDNPIYFRRMLKVYRQVDMSQHWEQLEKVQQRMWTNLRGRMLRHIYRRTSIRVASAAAVVLLGIGVYFWQNWSGRDLSLGQPVARYEAGSAKAVLRLASGEEIPLTLEENRQVATLEGVTMVQDSAGRLRVEDGEPEPEEEVMMHTIAIPEGGEYQMVLADGTKVWLNSATELTFPSRFTGGQREVTLKGEAYFEVQSDAVHPFLVKTDRALVKVLGTAFNVASYTDAPNIQVALLRGSVAFGDTGDAVVLKPGEIADLDRRDGRTTVKEGDVEAIIAWTNGRFNFDNMPLEELIPQLERWYGVKFEFDDAACRGYRFTGAVTKYRELNYVLEMIASMAMVTFKEQEGKIHVRKVVVH